MSLRVSRLRSLQTEWPIAAFSVSFAPDVEAVEEAWGAGAGLGLVFFLFSCHWGFQD